MDANQDNDKAGSAAATETTERDDGFVPRSGSKGRRSLASTAAAAAAAVIRPEERPRLVAANRRGTLGFENVSSVRPVTYSESVLVGIVALLDGLGSNDDDDDDRRKSEKTFSEFHSDPSGVRQPVIDMSERLGAAETRYNGNGGVEAGDSPNLVRSWKQEDDELSTALKGLRDLSVESLDRCSSANATTLVNEDLAKRVRKLEEDNEKMIEECQSSVYGFSQALSALNIFLTDFVVVCLQLPDKQGSPLHSALLQLKEDIEKLPQYLSDVMRSGIHVALDEYIGDSVVFVDEGHEAATEVETLEEARTKLAEAQALTRQLTHRANRKVVDSLKKAKQCQLKFVEAEKKLNKSHSELSLAEEHFRRQINRLRCELKEYRAMAGPRSSYSKKVAESMRSLVEFLNCRWKEAEGRCQEAMATSEKLKFDLRQLESEKKSLQADLDEVRDTSRWDGEGASKRIERLLAEKERLLCDLQQACNQRDKVLTAGWQDDKRTMEAMKLKGQRQAEQIALLQKENSRLKEFVERNSGRSEGNLVFHSPERSPEHAGEHTPFTSGRASSIPEVRVAAASSQTLDTNVVGVGLENVSVSGSDFSSTPGMICLKCNTKFPLIVDYEIHIRDCYNVRTS